MYRLSEDSWEKKSVSELQSAKVWALPSTLRSCQLTPLPHVLQSSGFTPAIWQTLSNSNPWSCM
jgi:hypothetical protein